MSVKISDPNFYKYISRHYAKYTIPKTHKTMRQICFPKKYELQIPQKFLANFINPNTQYKGILVYHEIGSGKSCTAINICENFKGRVKQIMVVLPASLKGNFRSELRSQCSGENYLTSQERNLLKKLHPSDIAYKSIIMKSDEKIDKYYSIYSYNKFIDLINTKKINFESTLLIIDEIHNMISDVGTYYSTLKDALDSAPKDLRLVLMSATPIFDKPIEIALTMNLLLRNEKKQFPIGTEFISTFIDITYHKNSITTYTVKNIDKFKALIKGYVSYFRGAQPNVFPATEWHFVKCKMSDSQYNLYSRIMKHESKVSTNTKITKDYINTDISNSFYIGTRMVSNFMFPNKQIGLKGFESLEKNDFSVKKLKKYSPKFLRLLRKVNRCSGTVFIYSSFKAYGGLKVLVKMFEYYGYKNYQDYAHGRKRFAVWSGDESLSYKDEVKAVFNAKDNTNGSQIKIILGSPSLREGVSLLRVQQVHLLEPYWNMSRINQIVGRAVRFCSHKDVDEEKRLVKIYIYLSVYPKLKESVDQKIIRIALNKRFVNRKFETALKEAAIDCTLFYNGNVYKGDDKLNCMT